MKSAAFPLCLAFLIALCVQQGFGQTATQNYIRTRTPLTITSTSTDIDNTTSKLVDIQYFDGLGRATQKINQAASRTGKDIITQVGYDAFNRKFRNYLPYIDSLTDGSYRTNVLTGQAAFYTSNASHVALSTTPFADISYEASPLSRTLEQGAPGADWQLGTSHTVRTSYGTNATGAVALWSISGTTVSGNQAYLPGSLFLTSQTDENGNTTQTFTDLLGNVVLKNTPIPSGAGPADYYQTYYVYNDLNQLAYVVTPGAIRQLVLLGGGPVGTLSFSDNATDLVFNEHVYAYHYDGRGRVIAKKIPGKDWEYIIYNKLDQPVLTQDGNLRAGTAGTGSANSWLFTKYDAQGRVAQTGFYINTVNTTPASVQTLCDQNTTFWETRPDTVYTNVAFPTQSLKPAASPLLILTTNYYDDYNYHMGTNHPAYNVANPANAFYSSNSKQVRGDQTGSKTHILNSENVLGTVQNIVSISYFDPLKHLIQLQTDNQNTGSQIYDYNYDFNGKVIASNKWYWPRGWAITMKYNWNFDNQGRKTDFYTQAISNSVPVVTGPQMLTAHYNYDDLNRLVEKNLNATNYTFGGSVPTGGYTFLQSLDYRYNIRGWLSSINNAALSNDGGTTNNDTNDLFGEQLSYNETGTGLGSPQYNGNIAGMKWQNLLSNLSSSLTTGLNSGPQGYKFTYDAENRLSWGQYATLSGATWTPSTTGTIGISSEKASYDVMGNISALQRNSNSGTVQNNFTYTYLNSGNKLSNVADAGAAAQTSSYTYDANGNMLTDSKKGVTITYNYLNLPNTVSNSSGTLTYGYDANGKKLFKVVTGTGAIREDYFDEYEASNGVLSFIRFEEGKVIPTVVGSPTPSFFYEYQLKDHLGNTRISFNSQNALVNGAPPAAQINDYYPFGADYTTVLNSANNKYKYNAKELQTELNLNLYDYGARFYDPIIGRFTSVDPLAENHEDLTPYNYVMNNPLVYGDEWGMDTTKQTINLPGVTAVGVKNAPNQDFSGFWGQANYYWHAGNIGKYHYNPNGKATSLAPIMGYPPDASFEGFSWSSLKSIGSSFRNIKKLLGLAKYTFKVIDQEGSTVIYSVKIGEEIIEFGGDFNKVDDVLTIKNFDVDGDLKNKLGNSGIKEIINEFGKDQGVSKIVIEGAKRTTGANPGRLPKSLIFNIK